MELCDRSWEGIFSLELHLAIGVAQLLVRPSDSSTLVVELDGHRGVWQLPSRCTLLVFTRGSKNDKAHQYANGSILESSTASRNVPVSRKRESTQRDMRATHYSYSLRGRSISFVHMRKSSLLISANPKCNIVVDGRVCAR